MESDYETLMLNTQPVTIRQCAEYTLSLPLVEKALSAFYVYQATTDRLIDSLVGLHETNELPIQLDQKEEQSAFLEIIKDMEMIKEQAFDRIMQLVRPRFTAKWYKGKLAEAEHNGKKVAVYTVIKGIQFCIDKYKKKPCKDLLADYHLMMFRQFTLISPFVNFMLTQVPPFIQNGVSEYSRKESLVRVFCLFIWMTMANHRRVSEQLDYRQSIGSFSIDACELKLRQNARDRYQLLCTYKNEIRLDGSGFIRLSFDDIRWGSVFVDDSTQSQVVDANLLTLLKGPKADTPPLICRQCNESITGTYFVFNGEDPFSDLLCSIECLDFYTQSNK